jgi:hypothetical protein
VILARDPLWREIHQAEILALHELYPDVVENYNLGWKAKMKAKNLEVQGRLITPKRSLRFTKCTSVLKRVLTFLAFVWRTHHTHIHHTFTLLTSSILFAQEKSPWVSV